jgi:hypothetical protein
MSDKASSSNDNVSAAHNETEKIAYDSKSDGVDRRASTGRRESVAMNIVVNPLKVSLISCFLMPIVPWH